MPQSVYARVNQYPMPMAIPKPLSIGDTSADLHYMSFKEAHALPFTSEHKPSLKESILRIAAAAKKREAIAISKLGAARLATSLSPNITKLKNTTAFKIASAIRVRGVVDCKTCSKPRCIYSQSVVSQMKPPSSLVLPDNHDSTVPTMTKEEI